MNYGMGFEVTKVGINVCFYSNWDYSFKVFKWKYECTENADENSNNQFHLNLAWIQYLLTLIPLLHAISPSIYIIIMICFYFCTLSGLSSQLPNILYFLLSSSRSWSRSISRFSDLKVKAQEWQEQTSLIQINENHFS